MKSIKFLGYISIALLFFAVSCLPKPKEQGPPATEPAAVKKENPFLAQYAGAYEIKVKGYSGTDKESYELLKYGSAKWIMTSFLSDTSSRAWIKSGTWTASDGEINVTIEGNSGDIKLTYNLQNGRFVEDLSSDRYLVKQ